VILFGPIEAKNELANSLKDNHLFEKKITVIPADKMTVHSPTPGLIFCHIFCRPAQQFILPE